MSTETFRGKILGEFIKPASMMWERFPSAASWLVWSELKIASLGNKGSLVILCHFFLILPHHKKFMQKMLQRG